MCEEFLLKWNDYHSSFSALMQSICLKEEMTDCTISNGTKSFYAHRMVLSTCSPYFRSLFSTLPTSHHPVIFIKDIQDEIVELLVRYMYSGQVSVSPDQIYPLVNAAKSLAIKGLLDVPVPDSNSDLAVTLDTPKPPPLKKPKINKAEPVKTRHDEQKLAFSDSKQRSSPLATDQPPPGNGHAASNSSSVISLDDDNSLDDEDFMSETEPQTQNELLQRLTSEITAYPFVAGGQNNAPQITIYSCEHCGKEFTSKRKHQRHVLNVHFGYNPVQCPFCNKGHRDNYNLKQHVCPVLNMKYGQFEKKGDGGGEQAAAVKDLIAQSSAAQNN